MSAAAKTSIRTPGASLAWPLAMAFVRLPLILLGALLVWGALAVSGHEEQFLWPLGAALAMNFVNLLCMVLLVKLLHREGKRLGDLLDFDRSRLRRDFAWGLCWVVVLNTAYLIGLFVPLLIVGGIDGIADGTVFEQAFVGAWASTEGNGFGPVILALFAGWMLVFPFLNAPVEELQYRAYVQPRLHTATGSAWIAVAVPSVGFALQHAPMAPSMLGMIAYIGMFLVWGVGASLIYLRQKRLMPLVFTHLITNLPVTFLALGFLFWS